MSFFGKLKFWGKKEDDFEDLTDQSLEPLPTETPQQPTSPFEHNIFNQPPTSFPQSVEPNKDMELINSKLDTIKAVLNSLDQRLAQVEQSMGIEQRRKLW